MRSCCSQSRRRCARTSESSGSRTRKGDGETRKGPEERAEEEEREEEREKEEEGAGARSEKKNTVPSEAHETSILSKERVTRREEREYRGHERRDSQ